MRKRQLTSCFSVSLFAAVAVAGAVRAEGRALAE